MFKFIGAVGLIVVSVGILKKDPVKEDILFIIGGICLGVYSIYIRDWVFIVLQLVFVISAAYELVKIKKSSKKINL